MRKQDSPAHHITSFARYLNKVFDFRTLAGTLTDSRVAPEISPAAVFLATFHGFVFRLPSFQQMETELAQPALQRWVGADRAFRDDVLRYSLSGFSLSGLEAMLVHVNRTLKRNKAFDTGRVQGRIVAALDGIEVLSSYSRCCDSCLERRVVVRKNGIKTEQLQYYHRAVGCQITSSPVKAFLAFEWLQPNEGEETAALRLLRRLPELYGSPFFDILLLDALYAQTAVLDLAQQIGWDVVISLKQNQPDLYKSAVRLFSRRSAATTHAWSVSLVRKKPSPKTITAKASFKPSRLLTNGSGSPRSTPKPLPLPKCAGSAMIVGFWRTTAGTISLNIGRLSMAFCTPADIALKRLPETATVSPSITVGWPPSPSFCC